MLEKKPGEDPKIVIYFDISAQINRACPPAPPPTHRHPANPRRPFFAADQSSQPGAVLDVEKVDPAEIETKPDLLANLKLTIGADLGNKQILRPV